MSPDKNGWQLSTRWSILTLKENGLRIGISSLIPSGSYISLAISGCALQSKRRNKG